MRLAIQRRLIYLAPPSDQDLDWLLESGEGIDLGPFADRTLIAKARDAEKLVVGIIHRTRTRERIGWVLVFPPMNTDFWELVFAIPNRKHRDGFSALYAIDAMCSYMFDHRGIEAGGCRIREDNHASYAIASRIGLQPIELKNIAGKVTAVYRFDKNAWQRRRAELERREAEYPSGAGGALVVLT
jgi:RimJ/RimL family protein N-acetyltransferase